jgi:hypothetical protein
MISNQIVSSVLYLGEKLDYSAANGHELKDVGAFSK